MRDRRARAGLFLAAAIVLEVTGSLSLKAALDGPAFYALVAVGYVGAFTCLTNALRSGMPLGIAYGVWGACGVALTALLSSVVFGDPLNVTMGVGIVLIIVGVLCVEMGSSAARRGPEKVA